MFERFLHCVCWCRLWVGQRRVYTPHSSSARRCKQRPSTHRQRQRVSTGGESVSACVTHKLKGTSFDGVLTSLKINTLTHQWPNLDCHSFHQPHTCCQATQWSSVHPLKHPANSGEWKQAMEEEITPWSLPCYQTAHSIASPPVVTQFVSFFFFLKREDKTHDGTNLQLNLDCYWPSEVGI